jgi:hypothetical protein
LFFIHLFLFEFWYYFCLFLCDFLRSCFCDCLISSPSSKLFCLYVFINSIWATSTYSWRTTSGGCWWRSAS